MRLWLAEIRSGTPQPLVEHDELRWLPAGRWHEVPWLDGDVRIVEALAREIGQGDPAPLAG
jgi:8-oxo-dGTP diphosphatase